MTKELLSIYNERVEIFTTAKKKVTNLLSYISIIRLILFLLFAWFFYSAFAFRFQGYHLSISLITFLAFVILVFIAGTLKKKNNFFKQIIRINQNEINILHGKVSFLATEVEKITIKGYASDLTIFGNHSLFQLLNRAGSIPGKQQLAFRLLSPLLQPLQIRDCQIGVKELSAKIDFRQTLLAHSLFLEEKDDLAFLTSLLPTSLFAKLMSRNWSILAIFWPFFGLLLLCYSVIVDHYQYLILFGIVGLLIMSLIFKKTTQLYNHISKKSYLFNQYAKIFQLISKESFNCPLLIKKQNEIIDASGAFQQLTRIGSLYDLRLSIFSFFINGLFLYDFLCARAYLSWNKSWGSKIDNWMSVVGEIEMMNSLATFHYNHPAFIFPDFSDEAFFIHAKSMGHPLMNREEAVLNDFSIGQKSILHIITGSNMSGKSTFLRTLGLNMVLAQIGAPVFAKEFVCKPVRILTSFHHIDSLHENSSYFYSELKSLHEIIISLDEQIPALVLLDEVMRGTNSKDKHDGTALLIKKLLQFTCLTLIATHDTDLGVLAETHPGKITNFCFESELNSNELSFNFKMQKGVAQSKNATFLMKKMGII